MTRVNLDELRRLAATVGQSLDEHLVDDEHYRLALYRQALLSSTVETDGELLTVVLAEPDRAMVEAVVVEAIDRAANQLVDAVAFARWGSSRAEVLTGFDFAKQRVAEWTLFKRLVTGQALDVTPLRDSSTWLQRMVATTVAQETTLGWLAAHGRTRKVRNIAEARLRRR